MSYVLHLRYEIALPVCRYEGFRGVGITFYRDFNGCVESAQGDCVFTFCVCYGACLCVCVFEVYCCVGVFVGLVFVEVEGRDCDSKDTALSVA